MMRELNHELDHCALQIEGTWHSCGAKSAHSCGMRAEKRPYRVCWIGSVETTPLHLMVHAIVFPFCSVRGRAQPFKSLEAWVNKSEGLDLLVLPTR